MNSLDVSPKLTGHPELDELSAFYFGRLPAGPLQEVADHLDHCSDCQSNLQALEGKDDPLVAGLRQPVFPDPFTSEPACQKILNLVQAFGMPAGAASGHEIDLGQENRRGTPSKGKLGQYQLLEPLGRGGMGTVYKAMHTRLKRVVAVKVLSSRRINDPISVARFHREMEAVGKLAHPNIVRATDAGELDGIHFLVMEYVEGMDLARIVKACGPLPIADACGMIRQAALGLQHAHQHRLVHRDIKPSNLMLNSDGQTKVLDLGLALLQGDRPMSEGLTAAGQVMGTFDYMAPEQGDDTHTVDIRADIYSLGCTLYHLLAGNAPFTGPSFRTFRSKMRAHAQEPVPPIPNSQSSIPAELTAVLDRMLAKDPGARFATPAEVATALEPFTAGNSLAALLAGARLKSEAERQDPEPLSHEDFLASPLAGTDPAARPASTEQMVERHPAESEKAIPVPAVTASGKSRRVLVLTVAAGLLLAGGAILTKHLTKTKQGPRSETPVSGKQTEIAQGGAGEESADHSRPQPASGLAAKSSEEEAAEDKVSPVYPTALFVFEERGSGAKEMGAKVSDILFARLGAKPDLYLVDRQELNKTLAELELNLSGVVKPADATHVGQLTGAKILVTGSVVSVDKKLYLVAKVIGTETSRVLSASVEGKASDDLAPLAEKLADEVGQTIVKQADSLVAKPVTRADRLAALKEQLKKGKRPTLMVKINERQVGAAPVDPSAQTEFTLFCKEAGFEVIDPDEGSRKQADVIVTGEGISELAGRQGNLVTVKARVEVKAVDRQTDQVLAVDRQTTVVVDLTDQLAGKQALQEAAAELALRVLPKLVKE